MDKSGLLRELEENSLPICESCLEGKMTKRPFTGKSYRGKELLELVHSDHYGPMNVKARGGYMSHPLLSYPPNPKRGVKTADIDSS